MAQPFFPGEGHSRLRASSEGHFSLTKNITLLGAPSVRNSSFHSKYHFICSRQRENENLTFSGKVSLILQLKTVCFSIIMKKQIHG